MRWLAILLVSALLAGCSGAPGTDAGSADTHGGDPPAVGGDVANATANAAPEARLNVTLDGLEAVFNITVADGDGDALQWTLDADGDGEADANGTDSASVNFTFMEAGNFTATLNVTDGSASTQQSVLVVATATAPLPPGQDAAGSFDAGGATLIGCFGDIIGVGFPAQLDGLFYATFAVDAHTVGYGYTASVAATVQDSPGFAFLRADRSVITSGFMSTHGAGTVPAEASTGVWWTCAGAMMTGTFTSAPPA